MAGRDHQQGRCPVIAVIGGGASGTLAAAALLREAAASGRRVAVLLLEASGRFGLGRAYATTHPCHLLNSPAGRMSGIAGDPGHLTRWAQAAGIAHDGFLPRRDYGRYLGELLAEAERAAWPGATLRRVGAEVTALSPGGPGGSARALRIGLAAGPPLGADAAVLAIGSPPPAPPCPVPVSSRYVADPWAPGALRDVGDGSPVLIVGTGLTMLDVAMTVTDADPAAVVHAVSRHGLLPREHRGAPPPGAAPPPLALPAAGPLRLAALVRAVRQAAAEHDGDWQDVIDAVRPRIPELWQRLPLPDQQLFLRRYARYWEVHRHRVPPATARRAAALRAAGRLVVHRGRIAGVTAGPAGLRARLEQADAVTGLEAGWLVNGTGQSAGFGPDASPLLDSLLRAGLARPDPLRLGLDADPAGALLDSAGRASARIYAIGPPLRGVRYETTAIAEIAVQARDLARRLAGSGDQLARPGSAA